MGGTQVVVGEAAAPPNAEAALRFGEVVRELAQEGNATEVEVRSPEALALAAAVPAVVGGISSILATFQSTGRRNILNAANAPGRI